MKKVFGLLLLVLSVCTLCGCSQGYDSGKVTYEVGTSKLHLTSNEDLTKWNKIQNLYKEALKAVDGATYEAGTSYVIAMEGIYKNTNAAVLKACESVENEADAITLSDGYIVLAVSATYWSGATDEVIYTHTFGQP